MAIDKNTLNAQTDRVNDAIIYFKSKKLTETNDLIKAASVWVAEQIGLKSDCREKTNLDRNEETWKGNWDRRRNKKIK